MPHKCRCCRTPIAAGHYCPRCRAELQALLDDLDAGVDAECEEKGIEPEEVEIEIEAEYGEAK